MMLVIRLFIFSLLFPSLSGAADDAPILQETSDVTVEQHLQSLSTVPRLFERRDPFMTVGAPFQIPAADPTSEDMPVMSAPIMERYRLSQYEVVAVLLGDKYPRALLRLPGETGVRKVVVVKVGDKVGNRGGAITKITTAGITVVYSHRSRRGRVTKVENLLQVGGTAEAQKSEFAANVPAEPTAGNK